MTWDVTCLLLNKLDQRMLLIISWIEDQSIKTALCIALDLADNLTSEKN